MGGIHIITIQLTPNHYIISSCILLYTCIIGESIVRDKFYGTGLSLHHKDATDQNKWQQNKLGTMLMKERTVLKAALNQ